MELDQYDEVYKIIVVGDSSVGKTNLIHCYSKGKVATNTMPTVGVEYTSKIIPLKSGKRAKVQIWDTAGQQQYRSITMNHYKKALGALIVFDITNPHSFSSLQYWVNIIKQRADQSIQIGFIGNKTDLASKRAISEQDAESLAKKLNAFYLETSVKDFMSIQMAFEKLVQIVYEVQKSRDHFADKNIKKINANNDQNSGCKC